MNRSRTYFAKQIPFVRLTQIVEKKIIDKNNLIFILRNIFNFSFIFVVHGVSGKRQKAIRIKYDLIRYVNDNLIPSYLICEGDLKRELNFML